MNALAMLFPLRTGRLTIEPFSEVHLTSRYLAWLNDAEVVQFSEQRHKQHTLTSCREYMLSFADSSDAFLALVTRSEEARHIGNMTIAIDEQNSVADLSILIGDSSMWGQGYATEAWTAVCHALLANGVRKISAGTLASNTGMLKVMQRAGMVLDGHRRAHRLVNEQPVDVIYGALFANAPQ